MKHGLLLFLLVGLPGFALSSAFPGWLPARAQEAATVAAPRSILQRHVQLLERLDAWNFEDLSDFFVPADAEKDRPLVFLTDGYAGAHESWRGVGPMELVQRWALTTGNQTRLGRVQIEESRDGGLGFAALEFERDCPMTSGETVTKTFRLSSVLRFSKDHGWRIQHLHISDAGGARSGQWAIGVQGPEAR